MAGEYYNYGTNESSDDKKDYDVDTGYASSEISNDDPRATQGVKAIEAISQAWTGWSLAIAYFGYVHLNLCLMHSANPQQYPLARQCHFLGAADDVPVFHHCHISFQPSSAAINCTSHV